MAGKAARPAGPGQGRSIVTVRLGGPLMTMAGGTTEFEIEAATVHEMLERLGARYPVLAPVLEGGVAVAVNGAIHHGSTMAPIPEGSEVYLLPALPGG